MISDSPSMRPPQPISVMGVEVVPFESYEQAVAHVEVLIECEQKSFWVAINPQKVYDAWHEPRLLAVLQEADVGICDGVGVSLAARILCGRGLFRCTGCDLFFQLIPLAAKRRWGVYLLGASRESNERTCRSLLRQYPDLQIVGHRDGYFRSGMDVVKQINQSGADMLFVAMGSPKQEYWIADHRDCLNVRFLLGVGGSFDVASGRTQRAPEVLQRTGTEFVFRLLTQPWRWRRQRACAAFMLEVLRRKFFRASPVS